MSFTVEKLEKNMAKLTITVPADKFAEATVQAYNKQKSRINVPGFRQGKVPQAYIEKMYGPEIFFDEAANIVMPDAYAEAYEACELEIVSQPEIDVVEIGKGKDFVFTATVAVKPEVTLGEYKGIKVAKVEVSVSDEEVEAELLKAQEQNSRTIDAAEDAVAENGDIVVIDFDGYVDGEQFEGGYAENYELKLGSHSFIDTFEDQLVGKKIGDEVEVFVTFPEEYHAQELAGKPAMFKVKVNAMKKIELPALDDEFASEVSEFDTLDEYKEDIKKTILVKKETEAKRDKEDAVVEKIIENATMEIPEAMITTQQNQMKNEFAQQLQMQGINIDQYFQITGMTEEKFLESCKPQATKRIQSSLVLEAIAKAEGIEASEDEVKAEIQKLADTYQMEYDQVEGLIGDAEKENMKQDIAVRKAVDLVRDAAIEE